MLKMRVYNSLGEELNGEVQSLINDGLKTGKIIAVKGLGGYHLACDAFNEKAVALLRKRKERGEKPFALMARDLFEIKKLCQVEEGEKQLLTSAARPIVLLKLKKDLKELIDIAPGQKRLGIMLPYAPWHELLLKNFPLLVMTSGNFTEEPIVYQDEEAFKCLANLADLFLLHEKEIPRPCDDSVAIVVEQKRLFLRRSRGFSTEPIYLKKKRHHVLACGGEQKNTICIVKEGMAFLSSHIGDLSNYSTLKVYIKAIEDLRESLDAKPEIIAYDLHPDYLASKYALEQSGSAQLIGVQHHHGHFASVLAEHGLKESVIGVIFDGTGYGLDGAIWGGEFLVGDSIDFQRWGHFAYTPMPSGSLAIKEPWRMAVGYLYQTFGKDMEVLPLDFLKKLPQNWFFLQTAMEKEINTPLTSSCGRVFDGLSALLGLKKRVSFEGQAAMLLEQIAYPEAKGEYPFTICEGFPYQIDLKPMWLAVVLDLERKIPKEIISGRFHNTISRIIFEMVSLISRKTGLKKVALSGGVFQNTVLLKKAYQLLQKAGFNVYLQQYVPPNDGGLSLGQAFIALSKTV